MDFYTTSTTNYCVSGAFMPYRDYDIKNEYIHIYNSSTSKSLSARSSLLETEKNPKPTIYKNFNIDDFKYSDTVKSNFENILKKRKFKNVEECIEIINKLSPDALEVLVSNYVHKKIKGGMCKMLRKLKSSDVIAVAYDAA